MAINDSITEKTDTADDPDQVVQITWLITMRVTDIEAARRAAVEAVAKTEGLEDEERAARLEDLSRGVDAIAFELFDAVVKQEPELPGFEAGGWHMHVD
ncbi:MAG: hypothetical protein ACSHW9_03335 [Salinibacterium amurskyense]